MGRRCLLFKPLSWFSAQSNQPIRKPTELGCLTFGPAWAAIPGWEQLSLFHISCERMPWRSMTGKNIGWLLILLSLLSKIPWPPWPPNWPNCGIDWVHTISSIRELFYYSYKKDTHKIIFPGKQCEEVSRVLFGRGVFGIAVELGAAKALRSNAPWHRCLHKSVVTYLHDLHSWSMWVFLFVIERFKWVLCSDVWWAAKGLMI